MSKRFIGGVLSLVGLGGCTHLQPQPGLPEGAAPPYSGGAYYKNDGPGAHIPSNLANIPDAVPKVDPLRPAANKPYRAFGVTYVPLDLESRYHETGLASWYGRRYHGKRASVGEPYDMYAMTAAHPTLPIPSYVRVANPANGASVVVRITDRGPFHPGRIIDLSYTAAYKLGVLQSVTPVEVELLHPGQAPGLQASVAEGPLHAGYVRLQFGAFTDEAGAAALLATLGQVPNLAALVIIHESGWYKVQTVAVPLSTGSAMALSYGQSTGRVAPYLAKR